MQTRGFLTKVKSTWLYRGFNTAKSVHSGKIVMT